MDAIDKATLILTMQKHKICVVIPTFNNGGTLRQVISDVLDYASDVIVVNDGSTDCTADILKEFKDRISIVGYTKNRGKGYALVQGFMAAGKLGYEYAITMDSDGQHKAAQIENFVKAIIEDKGALIVGERYLADKNINKKSSFANKFSNFWFTIHTARRLKDTQSGFRAYPLNLLPPLKLLTNRYEAELELLVLSAWKGIRIKAIPIDVFYPEKNERVSHFRPMRDFARISLLNTIFTFSCVVYGYPRMLVEKIRKREFFNNEIKFFTRSAGVRRNAHITLRRIFRSFYALSHFLFWTVFEFKPFMIVAFKLGKANDKKRDRLRMMMHRRSAYFGRKYPGGRVVIENPTSENFSKPAMIISNHQSHLDLPVLMSLSPKLVFLTNDWVWNNRIFGRMIKEAEFLPVSLGMEKLIPRLTELRDKGFSIMVFPEGSRSEDCSVKRFRQGAFAIAKELELDIVPLVLHGPGDYLPKNDFLLKRNTQTVRILPRRQFNLDEFATLYKTASFYRKLITDSYNEIRNAQEYDYYISDAFYKFAYTGWKTVARCKNELGCIKDYDSLIDKSDNEIVINSPGTGIIPLLMAMKYPEKKVICNFENLEDFIKIKEMTGLPGNLEINHLVWERES